MVKDYPPAQRIRCIINSMKSLMKTPRNVIAMATLVNLTYWSNTNHVTTRRDQRTFNFENLSYKTNYGQRMSRVQFCGRTEGE